MKRIMRKRLVETCVVGVLMTLGVALSPFPVQAVPIIDFGTGTAGTGGTITSLGGGNYSGAGIPVDVLSVTGAPGAGVYDLSGAFVSGTAVGGNSAVLAFNTSTGSISITGGVPALVIGSTTLLSGSFSSFTVTGPIGNTLAISGLGPDAKDPYLLSALGLSPTLPFNFFGFTISADFNSVTGTGTATSTDIVNTAAVPEPATLLLLGSGLMATGWFGRKRLKGPKA